MPRPLASARRDPRYAIPPGRCTVEFVDPGDPQEYYHATLTKLSVCGVEFEVRAPESLFPVDTVLTSIITVGSFKLAGEIAVRASWATGDGRVEVGGLFYPGSQEVEQVLAALVAGIEAAQPAAPAEF
jgi:hypothetical protein